MCKRAGAIGLLICLWLVPACGPMQTPMVPRLDDAEQQQINQSWNKALTPVDRLGRQELLDVLVVTQAYQLGVDRLHFQSEKRFSGGLVVMEVVFDRLQPELDRFVLTVFDPDRKPVRAERFSRADVEQTIADLFTPVTEDKPDQQAEQLRKRLGQEGRLAAVREFFPTAQKPEAQPKD